MAAVARPSRSRRRSRFHRRMISRSFSASMTFTRGFAQCERKENKSQAARNSVPGHGCTLSRGLRPARSERRAHEPAVALGRNLPSDEAPVIIGGNVKYVREPCRRRGSLLNWAALSTRRARAKPSCFKRSTGSMRIRHRVGTVSISVPVTGSATSTVISLHKIRQPGDIRGPCIAVADTRYRAATVPTSIFGMASVIPTARCHRNFNRAGSIAVPNMTKTIITNVVRGAATIKHRGVNCFEAMMTTSDT